MFARAIKSAIKTSAVFSFLAVAIVSAQQRTFDGTWQMDGSKTHVRDGRVVEVLVIQSTDDGLKVSMKTKTSAGQEITTEFNGKVGQTCDLMEGSHKSQLTVWYSGNTLNASKEKGPDGDVTSMWKFEMAPDKQTMNMKISHYEPAAEDETLVFTKKAES